MTVRLFTAAVFFTAAPLLYSQTNSNTVGVQVHEPGVYPGYTLYTPLTSDVTYLINNEGELLHWWDTSYPPGNMQYLLPNGNLLRTADPGGNPFIVAGGDAGLVQEFDWDGSLVWQFFYSDNRVRAHHDVAWMPNGNVLMIAYERKNALECLQAGRNPALLVQNELWPEHIIEIQTNGLGGASIVWEWHVWDHLIQDFDPARDNFGVVGNHPERVDINYIRGSAIADWLHANAIDYNPDLDQIVLSVPAFGEVWVIDHSTTTEQAAGSSGGNGGRGGDLLYRWGNPRAYRRGTEADQHFFWQHGVHWIPPGHPGAGNLLVFNNGNGRPGGAASRYSTVDEIVPPINASGQYTNVAGQAFGPVAPTWSYAADPLTSMYSGGLSGAQRLPNGNTLICHGTQGRFIEVDTNGVVVWMYVNPASNTGTAIQGGPPGNNRVFQAEKYPVDYPGIDGRELVSHGTLEQDPDAVLEITRVERTDASVQISWITIPRANYQIQHSSTLTNPLWLTLDTVTAQGTLTHFEDANPVRFNMNSGFYRIEQVP